MPSESVNESVYLLNDLIKNLNLKYEKSIVNDLLNHHLQNTGKLVRPVLALKFGEWLDVSSLNIQHVSKAAEFIHSASLIHDDVVDEAKIRRDRETLNAKISNARAVLAGDFLLAQVIRDLVEIQEYELLKNIAQALKDMIEGEFLQDNLKSKMEINQEDLINISQKKTGALFAWVTQSMAILSKRDEDTINWAHEIGIQLGIAFQMMDDNLDYSKTSGKDFAKDLKEGILNFTTIELMNLYPELKNSIYIARGTNFTNIIWNDEQIHMAQKKVEEKIQHIFDRIFLLLNKMKNQNITLDNHHLLEIYELLDLLQKREK